MTPVIWIFADRNLCIAFFTLFVSYPLSLYRDISKLAKTSALALVAIVFITVSVAVEGPKVSSELRGSTEHRFDFMQGEIFQGIAVISFGKTKIMLDDHWSCLLYSLCLSPQ